MNYFSTMQIVLGVGMLTLMTGIVLFKQSEHGFIQTLQESVAWGIGFLVFFGSEFALIGII